jgi:hypothetical protein
MARVAKAVFAREWAVSTVGPKIGAMLTMLPIGVVAFAFASHSYEIGRSSRPASFWGLVREFRDWEWEKVGWPQLAAAIEAYKKHSSGRRWPA